MAITYVNGKDKLAAYLAKLTATEKAPPAVPKATAVPAVKFNAIECTEPKAPTEAGHPGMLAGIIATAKKLPGPNKPPRVRFLTLVRHVVENDPYEAEGFLWAARHQTWWAAQIGVSTKAIQRWTKKPPYRWTRKLVGGSPMVLLREGGADEMSPEDHARRMVAVWRKRVKHETHYEFGLFRELGKAWGLHGPAIISTVLDDWSGFMMTVHGHILETGTGVKKYFDYPTISVILKYRGVATAMHMHKLQSALADELLKADGQW